MKELLKSFGYTLVYSAATIAVVVIVCVGLNALERVSPEMGVAIGLGLVFVLITLIVHIIRTGN